MIKGNDWKEDIYRWKMGYDNEDLRFLTRLNQCIDLLYDLDDFQYYSHRMNVTSTVSQQAEEVISQLDPAEVAFKLELIRTLIFGNKINYEFLQTVLESGIEKYGYIGEKQNE